METFKVAPLMTGGIVTSLEILDANQGMGNRGSKPGSLISVKEQRVDGSLVYKQYYKVYSKCQGNLVFIQHIKYVNTIFESIQRFYTKFSYSNSLSFSNETMSSSFNYVKPNGLNPHYVTGFIDGEGCFYVSVNSNPSYITGYRVKAAFHIGVHIRDLALLKQIQSFFGVGAISKLGEETVQFRVYGSENLKVIINHFDKYPLLTNKQSDYLLFKQVVIDMEKGKHLTVEGLNNIMSIKAVMNNKEISDNLSIAFSNIKPILTPEIKDRQIKSLHWLAGFTDAEGCFFIALKKSSESKLGETVWLRFILTQHSRDEELLKSFISTLKCGRYITKSGYGEFIVEKFTDVFDKVIPIFEEFKLHGIKSKNYEDFKKAALFIKNKQHLTREGLDQIKKIKGGMNKNRIY